MDINSIMNTYNMSSLWNNINSNSNSTLTGIPITDNLDSSIQQSYDAMNFSGKTTSNELQDIFQQVEPDYGIPLTYNQLGNLAIPTDITPPDNGLPLADSNIVSLLQSGSSVQDTTNENILSQYDSIESGTYQYNISSILSSNPYNMYSNIASLLSDQSQNTNTSLDESI